MFVPQIIAGGFEGLGEAGIDQIDIAAIDLGVHDIADIGFVADEQTGGFAVGVDEIDGISGFIQSGIGRRRIWPALRTEIADRADQVLGLPIHRGRGDGIGHFPCRAVLADGCAIAIGIGNGDALDLGRLQIDKLLALTGGGLRRFGRRLVWILVAGDENNPHNEQGHEQDDGGFEIHLEGLFDINRVVCE